MKKLLLCAAIGLCSIISSNAQSCKVDNMWIEHNVYNYGCNGMRVHAEFDVFDFQGSTIQCCAYFMNAQGYPVPAPYNVPANYRTRDGQLCVGANGYVKYESSHWDDLTLFIPYTMFMAGDYRCVFQVSKANGELLGMSDIVPFTVVR